MLEKLSMTHIAQLYSNYSIAKITISEILPIYNIELSCYPNPWTKNNLIDEISNVLGFNWCIKNNDNEILGYIFSYIVEDEMFITNICVHPKHHNKKIATYLLKNIISKVLITAVKKVFLEVREKNLIAIKLYSSNGFTVDCVRRNFYTDGESAIMMHLDL